MPGARFIKGERVTLRTIEEEDVEYLHHNRNDPDVRHLMRNVDPVTKEEAEEGFEEWICSDGSVQLLACVDGEPIGQFSMFRFDEESRHVFLGAWVDADHQNEGYGTEATALLVQYAFDTKAMHKLAAHVFEPNKPSQGLMANLGFEREGVLRDEEYIDGEYVDTYRYSMLREDWPGIDEALDR